MIGMMCQTKNSRDQQIAQKGRTLSPTTATLEPLDRIIWSADVENPEKLQAELEAMPDLRLVKLDRLFLEGRDLAIIARVQQDMGFRVFDDSKMIEIPTKLRAVALKHLKYKPWMLNCMAGSVSSLTLASENSDELDGLKMFADACHNVGTLPCGVTVLTSKTDKIVGREYGRTPVDQVLVYVGILQECGFTDVVCSPDEVAAIRSVPDFADLNLNTPGIRLPDAAADDQARKNTPEGAVAAGATRLVIGRPITNGVSADNLAAIAARLPHAV